MIFVYGGIFIVTHCILVTLKYFVGLQSVSEL